MIPPKAGGSPKDRVVQDTVPAELRQSAPCSCSFAWPIESFILTRMPIRKFEPKFMKIGVLTAALQELTPRKVRDKDPDRAVEEWLEFGRELEVDYIQLSAALHPSEADVPPEAMLDPVANTLDLRKPFDKARAKRVAAAMKTTGIGLSDIAYFDNMLHHDPACSKKEDGFHVARLRCSRASGRRSGLWICRTQSNAQHGPESGGLRTALRSSTEEG